MSPSDPVYCAGCGGQIGTYEPVWCQHPDGTVHEVSLPGLKRHAARELNARLLHIECVDSDNRPSTA